MNQKIKEFWKFNGKEVRGYTTPVMDYWFIVSDPDYYDQGGPPPPLTKDVIYIKSKLDGVEKEVYFFEFQRFSEEEMLKIIRLKAFI